MFRHKERLNQDLGPLNLNTNEMKKILCPTDFSDISQNAIAYAAKFAKASDASLMLLNIQPTSSPALKSESDLVVSAVSERLEELSREVRQFFKISCEAEVIRSASLLTDALVERTEGYDLIVMGTHGINSLMEFFVGSKTYHATRKTRIPVMLVPPDCIFSEVKKVTYAYDYLHERKLPLKQLQIWINALQWDLTVLLVTEKAISHDVNEELKELQFIISDEWKEKNLKINFDSIASSEIAPSINSYMNRNEMDVLVLCTVHRNFIERLFHKSVIKIISEIASYPVFVFHE
jgi:nucleotide-binding universal stress UspA family protein